MMSHTYRPIRTVASAVPDRLKTLSDRVDNLSAMTSGQVHGTLAELGRASASCPTLLTLHRESTGWAPGGDLGAVAASATIQAPRGKTTCHIMAGVTGLAPADSQQDAPPPTVRVRVNGEISPPLACVPAGAGGWHLLGTHTAVMDVSRAAAVTVEVLVYGQGPSTGTRMSLDALIAFMP